jgi:hypothetical protein
MSEAVRTVRTVQRRAPLRVPATAVWLAAAVAIGAVLRLWGLGANRLGYDESFTAMAGRLPIGSLFGYLRTHDSHPPLDYLIHLPLARLGVSELVFRLPSALCSIGALALFAFWMRSRGRVGVLATVLMAVSTFEVLHGRSARMYAELELLGVAIAMLCEAWLRAPRRRHALVLGALVLVGLFTHVSMFLLAAGLFALAGRRTDRDAWRWRAAIVAAGCAWAVVWGPSFAVQATGGHSDWIPRTTISGVLATVDRLTTNQAVFPLVVSAVVALGGFVIWQRDRRLSRVWLACFAVPLTLAAVGGLLVPLLLDRTLTLAAWAPLVAGGAALDWLWRRWTVLGVVAVAAVLVLLVPSTIDLVEKPSGANHGIRALAALSRPGDVLAVRAAAKLPEVEWSLGVRGSRAWRPVDVPGVADVAGIVSGDRAPSGRVWVLDWNSRVRDADGYRRCAPDRRFGVSRILCLQRDVGGAAVAATTAGTRVVSSSLP